MQRITAKTLPKPVSSPSSTSIHLPAFVSTIAQPDGHPDTMLLNMAMQQPDRDKFFDAMAWELSQHTELEHWKIITEV